MVGSDRLNVPAIDNWCRQKRWMGCRVLLPVLH